MSCNYTVDGNLNPKESSDHSLTKIDQAYPVFVLGGIIINQDYARTEMEQQLNNFKVRLFGRTDIILHTADIVRQKNGFEKLADLKFRHNFYSELNQLMANLDFKVVACAIKKDLYVLSNFAKYQIIKAGTRYAVPSPY